MQRKYIEHNPLIHKALGEIMDRRVEAIPVIEHTFSPEFEQRMERLIRAQEKPYYRLINTNAKKAVLALAATFILMITTVFSVSALREPVVRFIVEVYEKFSTVLFHSHEEELTSPTTLETIYEPSWLPDGYTAQDEMMVLTDVFQIRYYMKDADIFEFRQHIVSTGFNFDTEGTEIQRMTVLEREAILYENKGISTLVWDDGWYGYTISGLTKESDLLRVAESLREK